MMAGGHSARYRRSFKHRFCDAEGYRLQRQRCEEYVELAGGGFSEGEVSEAVPEGRP